MKENIHVYYCWVNTSLDNIEYHFYFQYFDDVYGKYIFRIGNDVKNHKQLFEEYVYGKIKQERFNDNIVMDLSQIIFHRL